MVFVCSIGFCDSDRNLMKDYVLAFYHCGLLQQMFNVEVCCCYYYFFMHHPFVFVFKIGVAWDRWQCEDVANIAGCLGGRGLLCCCFFFFSNKQNKLF
jgi:hypothetical protein